MKIHKPKLLNTFSCQFCQRDFQTKIEYIIIPSYSPLCSNLCLFRFIYKILSHYDEDSLFYMAKTLNLVKKDIHLEKELCYRLSKHFVKIGLSNINIEAQGSGSRIWAQQSEPNGSKVGSGSKNPLYKGFEPVNLSLLSDKLIEVSLDPKQKKLWSYVK